MSRSEKTVLQSQIYRKVFELAKKEGIEAVSDFVRDYHELVDVDYLKKAVLHGKHDTLSFAKRHKVVTEFLKGLNLEEIPAFMTDPEFLTLMSRLDDKSLVEAIKGAGFLEELGIQRVSLMRKNNGVISGYRTTVWYDRNNEVSEIDKQYTNGRIDYYGIGKMGSYTYDIYRTSISFLGAPGSKYVLSMENRAKDKHSFISVSDFSFDTKKLPSREEIWSLEVPKTLQKSREYFKR